MTAPVGSEIKLEAKKLRAWGLSLAEISNSLKIAKSTVSILVKNVSLSDSSRKRLRERVITGREHAKETHRRKAEQRDTAYLKEAVGVTSKIQITPILAQAFCSFLYWAEGAKFTNNRLEFTNSDPVMIATFLKLLRSAFDVDEAKLRANIHLHEYHNEKKQKAFWQRVTSIPPQQFNKSYLKAHTKKVIRVNYPGCVRICYYSADTARRIRATYLALSERILGVSVNGKPPLSKSGTGGSTPSTPAKSSYQFDKITNL